MPETKPFSPTSLPRIQLTLEIIPIWADRLGPGGLAAALQGAASGVQELLALLGLSAQVSVQTGAPPPNGRPFPENLFYLSLEGRPCHYPSAYLDRAWQVTAADHLDDVQISIENRFEALDPGQIESFIRLLSVEILKLRPAVLLTAPTLEAYLAQLRSAGLKCPFARTELLRPILEQVLNQRLSLGDFSTVATYINTSQKNGASPAETAETLAAFLAPQIIEVRMSRAYLKEFTLGSATRASEKPLLANLHKIIFDELGVILPPLHFVPDDNLPSQLFCFKFNSLTSFPWRGLSRNVLLTNDTPERLKLVGINGRPWPNPAGYGLFSCIPEEDGELAHEIDLFTWDAAGYLGLAFYRDLRAQAGCLLNQDKLEGLIEKLKENLPELVADIEERFSMGRLTSILRLLLDEGLSIRNLRWLLQSLLEYDFIVVDDSRAVGLDPRLRAPAAPQPGWVSDPVNVTAYLRTTLKSTIGRLAARDQNVLYCYLLDPAMEAQLANTRALPPEEHWQKLDSQILETILWTIRSRMEINRASGPLQIVLTTRAVRPTLRRLLATVLPDLLVLSFSEVPPDLSIQSLGLLGA
jgi:flagellar biosynthesis component FlhA